MASSEDRPAIAIDLDEVLGGFVQAIARFHNDKYGTSLVEADFHSYDFSSVWGGSVADATAKVHAFFETDYFKRGIAVIDGAQEALRELSQHFRLYLITSRQHCIAEETQRWIEEHFAGVFEDMLFGNHYGRSGVKRTKLDMCLEVGAIALVDDSTAYALQCAAELRRVLLFGDYAWNQLAAPLPPNVARVRGWTEAKQELLALLDRAPPRRSVY